MDSWIDYPSTGEGTDAVTETCVERACVTNEVYQKNPKPYEKLVHHCGFET